MNLTDSLDAATRNYAATPQSVRATLNFSGREFFFEGHFPGDPVLPAMIQIDAALRLASRGFARPLALREVTRAVFKSPTGPGRDLLFDIQFAPAEQNLTRLKCSVSQAQGPVAEFTLRVA